MILFSASKDRLWVQRDGGIWSFLTGPKIICCFTGIRIWVFWWWRWRPFWFSKKIYVTFSSNWVFPYQGGCSQFLISSRKIDSSICDWKYEFSIFLKKYHFLCIESFQSRFLMCPSFPTPQCLQPLCPPFQILPAYRAYPRNNPGKTFFPNWWILDWSFAEKGKYSTNEPNRIIGPLNDFPKRLSYGVFP